MKYQLRRILLLGHVFAFDWLLFASRKAAHITENRMLLVWLVLAHIGPIGGMSLGIEQISSIRKGKRFEKIEPSRGLIVLAICWFAWFLSLGIAAEDGAGKVIFASIPTAWAVSISAVFGRNAWGGPYTMSVILLCVMHIYALLFLSSKPLLLTDKSGGKTIFVNGYMWGAVIAATLMISTVVIVAAYGILNLSGTVVSGSMAIYDSHIKHEYGPGVSNYAAEGFGILFFLVAVAAFVVFAIVVLPYRVASRTLYAVQDHLVSSCAKQPNQ